EQDPTFYYDWEGDDEFVLEDLGPGECAGGALEMIENGILEADQELYQARLLVEKHQYSVSVNKSYRAVLAATKALLVTEGIDPATDAETLREFEQRLAPKGVVPAAYRELGKLIGDLGPKETPAAFAQLKLAFSKGYVDACRAATERMGKDLKLGAETEASPAIKAVVPPVEDVAAVASASAPEGVAVYYRGGGAFTA